MDEHAQTVGNFLDGRHAESRRRIAALEAELAAADDRYLRLARWYGGECDRRRAAEELLRGVRTSTIDQLDFEIAPLIDAHFSRYKD